jgi:hypothetical protein
VGKAGKVSPSPEGRPPVPAPGEDPEFRRRLSSLIEEQKGALEEWLQAEGAALARDRILGMLAGLVLISPLWAAALAAGFGIFLLIERFFSRRRCPA